MISLANILFGDKKPANNTKPNNSNLSDRQVKHTSQNEKSFGNSVRNNQPEGKLSDLAKSMNQNISSQKTNGNNSKFQEIKKTIQNTNPKSSDSRNISIPNKVSNPREESLYSKLKNFNSIDEILNEVTANNQYSKLFKEDNKVNPIISKNEPSKLQGKYKPTTSGEAKLLKKIDELNKIKEGQEISMIGKKHTNKSEINRKSSKYVTADDIWCAKCRQWHDKDLHKPLFSNPKDFMASNNINMQRNVESPGIKKTIPLTKSLSTEYMTKNHPNQCQVQKSVNSSNFNNTANSNQKLKDHNEIMQKIKTQIQFDKVASTNNKSKEELNKQFHSKLNQKYSSNSSNLNKYISSANNKPKLETIKNMITVNNNRREIPIQRNTSINKVNKAPQKPIYNNNLSQPKSRPTQPSKSFSNYSPTNPGGQENLLFSRKDFEDDDNFIDDGEEESVDYRKYLDNINRKFRRGGGNYYNNTQQSDSDEVVEARFDEIEEEEKYTEIIGQKEDEEEEIKEMLEIERKKFKKSNK